MRTPGPGWGEVRPKSPQRQDAGRGALINQQAEELQRGRIDPVQVFHDKEHGLLGRNAQQDGQQDLQGLLLVLLRRHRQRGIVCRQREREQRRQEGHGFFQWQAILHHQSLQFPQLLLWRFLPLKAQRHPLQQIDPRIQGGILVIGRTLARCQPRLRFAGHVFLEHLRQARFADARFPTEQHYLPHAVFDLRPALQEQPHFLLAAHQRGQTGTAGRFQATARHALIQYLIAPPMAR